MKKTTLVIMAAGLGSRYGGIKQLEPVGPSGEIIMDYSIYDALEAGFNKIIFIIRRDLEKDFKEVIGNRISDKVEVEYVFQELDNLPAGFQLPKGRTKPWGTGQAILSCIDAAKEPFAVINADDYYGKEGFEKIHDYLVNQKENASVYQFCMAGFILGNTLSENGTVTRGVCQSNEQGYLVDIIETKGVEQVGNQAQGLNEAGEKITLNINGPVSMNMWGFTLGIFEELKAGFVTFLGEIQEGDLKAEYLLPEVVGDLVKEGKAEVRILDTKDKWFGVTYKEDKQTVIDSIRKLVDLGIYPKKLF